MRGTLFGLLAISLLGIGAAAKAETQGDPPLATEPAHVYGDQTAALKESKLEPAEGWRASPPNWNGDIPEAGPAPWVLRHQALRRDHLTPIVLPSVFPEVAARLDNVAGWHKAASGTDFDQLALLSLYYVDIYAPLVTLRDSASVGSDAFRLNLKIPWVRGHQAVTLFFGGDIPVKAPMVDGGFDSMLGYALGFGVWSLQARAGVGVERLVANARAPFAPSVLYDGEVAFRPLGWLELMAQVDGRKVLGANDASVRLWPALRFYPSHDRALSLAVGGLFWFDDVGGSWATHRTGGLVDVGYDFL